jgi:murein DD-endopeptidase MepM/ murein hydrolase activator NlpD
MKSSINRRVNSDNRLAQREAFQRLLVVMLFLVALGLNCARSYPGDSSEMIPLAASEEPGWFLGLPDSLPSPTPADLPPTITPEVIIKVPQSSDTPTLLYYSQAGDTLDLLAKRFGVSTDKIESDQPIPQAGLINPGQLLIIPNILTGTTPNQQLLPDSEVVFSPTAIDFDIEAFVNQAGGYLSTYRQWLAGTGWTSGSQVIARAALENSINPRLLLAILEYQSSWVYGQPKNLIQSEYPMGFIDLNQKDLYQQTMWAINQLSIGYYSWREGHTVELPFPESTALRLAPNLNAGTVAIQYTFAQLYANDSGHDNGRERWSQALDANKGLSALYTRMFGDPWERAQVVEPFFAPGLTQPALNLPFERSKLWSYTGGPHGAWEREGAWAALDFAPGSLDFGCIPSDAWVVASAPGLVVRSGLGVIVLDLDGDGYEQTGWALLYLHILDAERIPLGTIMERDTKLGHPSCKGGFATGTHLHMARKYNGEWIAADGPLPFDLDGWTAHSNGQPYKGTLTRNGKTITANTTSPQTANILRDDGDL